MDFPAKLGENIKITKRSKKTHDERQNNMTQNGLMIEKKIFQR